MVTEDYARGAIFISPSPRHPVPPSPRLPVISSPRRLFFQQRLEVLVDRGGDDLRALGVRVDVVLLVEFIAPRDAFEEEGDERHALLARERLKAFVNLALVVEAGVGGRVHAGEEHLSAAGLAG